MFFSVYLMSGAGHFFGTDHVATYLTTQSLVEAHTLAIKPIPRAVRGSDGNFYSKYGLGQSILSIPFYLLGKLVDNLSSPALKKYWGGVPLGDFGGDTLMFFVSLFNQFVTPLICLLVFRFCLTFGFPVLSSFLTTLLFGFTTSAWVYARDYFQHPLESLFLLWSVYILVSHRADLKPRHVWLAATSFAAGLLTRVNLIFIAPIVLLYLFFITEKKKVPEKKKAKTPIESDSKGRWQHPLIFSVPPILMFGLIFYLNYIRFGDILNFGYDAHDKGFSNPLWIGLYGNLFSLGRSIFLYSPLTLLALFTFGKFYRQQRREAILFLAIVIVYLLAYSSWWSWDGGWCWGPRFLQPIIPFLIIPSGYFLSRTRDKVIVAVIACLGIVVQILGVAVNYSYVHWEWLNMHLVPETEFLFVPQLSPIPTHWHALLAKRHIDLWLLEVYNQFGVSVFLWTLALPLLLLATSLILLRNLRKIERKT